MYISDRFLALAGGDDDGPDVAYMNRLFQISTKRIRKAILAWRPSAVCIHSNYCNSLF